MLIRCWKGVECLSAAWHLRSVHSRLHVNNRFAESAVTCEISKVRTSSERKLSLSATRQPFMVEIALLYVTSLSNSLVFVSFLRSDRSHKPEQAGSMPSTQAVAPRPSHNRDGREKVRTFDKITHRHKPFYRQRFVSVLWLRHAQLHDLVEVWALMGECSPPVRECSLPVCECSLPVRECSPPDRNRSIFFVQIFVDFALSLPGHSHWVCLHPWPWIFSQKRQIWTRNEN